MITVFAIVAIALLIVSLALAVGLFFVLLFKRKAKKNIELFSIGAPQALEGNETKYFSSIRYKDNGGEKLIILKQAESFKSGVVTLISADQNQKKKVRRFKLEFVNGLAAIKVEDDLNEYKVVLESVDKKLVKHPGNDNSFPFTIIYAVIVAAVYAAGIIMYVVMCSYYLLDYWADYATYYAFAAVALSFPVITIGGYILIDVLSRKGGF